MIGGFKNTAMSFVAQDKNHYPATLSSLSSLCISLTIRSKPRYQRPSDRCRFDIDPMWKCRIDIQSMSIRWSLLSGGRSSIVIPDIGARVVPVMIISTGRYTPLNTAFFPFLLASLANVLFSMCGRSMILMEHYEKYFLIMMSSNGNMFRITGPLWGEFTGHRWIPLTKASFAELWCFVWSSPEQTVDQTTETLVIWDAIALNMTSS